MTCEYIVKRGTKFKNDRLCGVDKSVREVLIRNGVTCVHAKLCTNHETKLQAAHPHWRLVPVSN